MVADTQTRRKGAGAEFKVSDGRERTFVAKITSSAMDRDREVLLPDGMRTTDFEQNPVMFWNHDYSLPPIGQVRNLHRKKDHWLAEGVFASRPESHPDGAEWFPDTVHDLMKQNVIRGVSVGLKPDHVRRATVEDKDTFGKNVESVVARWDLLELSVAPLPANQEALVQAVSKGLVAKSAVADLFPDLVEGEEVLDLTKEARKTFSLVVQMSPPPPPVPAVNLVSEITKAVRMDLGRARGRIYL